MKFDSIPVQVRLNTSWVNYNCGVRMAGRLITQSSFDGKAWSDGVGFEHLTKVNEQLKTRKVEFINEFITFISRAENIPPLQGETGFKNPVFPMDGGRYIPTAILVADDIIKTKQDLPWNQWASLVRELQENFETYNVDVFGGPLFQNAVYGSSNHISRVWQLTLPCYKNKLLKNHTTFNWNQGKSWGYGKEHLSSYDWGDLIATLPESAQPAKVAA